MCLVKDPWAFSLFLVFILIFVSLISDQYHDYVTMQKTFQVIFKQSGN